MLKPFHLRASNAHQRLLALAATDGERPLLSFFKENPNRFQEMHAEIDGMLMDLVEAAHFKANLGSSF